MKDRLVQVLTDQKEKGEKFSARLEDISSTPELNQFIKEYEDWDKVNSEILNKAYVHQQLYRMYSGVSYLGNLYDDSNSFQGKRDKILNTLPKKLGHLNTAIHLTGGIRNTDLLPFDEELKELEQSSHLLKTKNMKKLFISHSSIDKPIIDPLIDLIESIGVRHDQIFFSSSPAYGVGLGENIFERLKSELSSEVFALFILSENFYKSPVCLCEMGAVWIKSNKQIPILIPPFSFSDVKGVFTSSLGFKINDKDQLNSFKTELEQYFLLTPIHATRWEGKRDECLTKLSGLIK